MIRDYLTVTRAIDPVQLERARMAQVECGEVPEPETAARRLRLRRPPGAGHPHRPPQHRQAPRGQGRLRGHEEGGQRREPPLPLLPGPRHRGARGRPVRHGHAPSSARCAPSRCPAPGSSTSRSTPRPSPRPASTTSPIHHDQILVPVVLRHWDIEALEGLDARGRGGPRRAGEAHRPHRQGRPALRRPPRRSAEAPRLASASLALLGGVARSDTVTVSSSVAADEHAARARPSSEPSSSAPWRSSTLSHRAAGRRATRRSPTLIAGRGRGAAVGSTDAHEEARRARAGRPTRAAGRATSAGARPTPSTSRRGDSPRTRASTRVAQRRRRRAARGRSRRPRRAVLRPTSAAVLVDERAAGRPAGQRRGVLEAAGDPAAARAAEGAARRRSPCPKVTRAPPSAVRADGEDDVARARRSPRPTPAAGRPPVSTASTTRSPSASTPATSALLGPAVGEGDLGGAVAQVVGVGEHEALGHDDPAAPAAVRGRCGRRSGSAAARAARAASAQGGGAGGGHGRGPPDGNL